MDVNTDDKVLILRPSIEFHQKLKSSTAGAWCTIPKKNNNDFAVSFCTRFPHAVAKVIAGGPLVSHEIHEEFTHLATESFVSMNILLSLRFTESRVSEDDEGRLFDSLTDADEVVLSKAISLYVYNHFEKEYPRWMAHTIPVTFVKGFLPFGHTTISAGRRAVTGGEGGKRKREAHPFRTMKFYCPLFNNMQQGKKIFLDHGPPQYASAVLHHIQRVEQELIRLGIELPDDEKKKFERYKKLAAE